jgi:hypothetical protein
MYTSVIDLLDMVAIKIPTGVDHSDDPSHYGTASIP